MGGTEDLLGDLSQTFDSSRSGCPAACSFLKQPCLLQQAFFLGFLRMQTQGESSEALPSGSRPGPPPKSVAVLLHLSVWMGDICHRSFYLFLQTAERQQPRPVIRNLLFSIPSLMPQLGCTLLS